MKRAITLLVLIALIATLAWACGCGGDKGADENNKDYIAQSTEKDSTTTDTTEKDSTTTDTTGDDLEPGPRYDPYVPMEGEMVTPSDYDLGLQEGYEAGYWAGLADGMRGVYDADPVGYDDSNEYYVEGFLEGYQEGYDDGYSDGEEV
ncbi:MAG: hypothetical protein JW854_04280 [Actinobacteria bacterium]|nr:hypothetical protein [Actinomycetota bacterium]